MDLLIKKIEIPKDTKRLALFIDKDGEVTVFDGNEFKRITDAIEVPTHGRLIDADVIGNWLREQHVFSMPTTCKIDSIIKNAPTIVEAST